MCCDCACDDFVDNRACVLFVMCFVMLCGMCFVFSLCVCVSVLHMCLCALFALLCDGA